MGEDQGKGCGRSPHCMPKQFHCVIPLFLTLTAVVLLLAGCMTVGPDYEPPVTTLPQAWNTDVPASTAAPELAEWWRIFADPLLDNLMVCAQTNNLDLRQAEARLRQARAQRLLAGADRLPTLGAGGSARRSQNRLGSGADGTTTYDSSFDASWEVDLFGGQRRAVEAVEASLQASRESLRDVTVSLLAEVALNYVQYRAAQSRLAVVAGNLLAQTETYQLTVWRHEASLVTQLDVDQARMSLEQTRAELPALRTTLHQTEHQIALLLGRTPGSLVAELESSAPQIPLPAATLSIGFPADILRQRPDVRQAERKLAAQTAQIGVAAAARYPNLTLGGSIGYSALSLGDLYGSAARTIQGFVSAGLTLFDGGRIRQQVAIQTAMQEESLAAYQATVLTALKEVEDALVSLVNEAERQTAMDAAAAAAASAFALAQEQYAAGLTDFQSVLTSQQSLLATQNSLTLSHAEVASAAIRLYKALGGGWSAAPESNKSDEFENEAITGEKL